MGKFSAEYFSKTDNSVKVLANMRIDILSLKSFLAQTDESRICKSIKINSIAYELITFLFRYVFVELSKGIVASEADGFTYYFNIKIDSQKYYKYINKEDNTSSIDRRNAQKSFIKAYLSSFDNLDIITIKEIEKDLIYMSKETNQKKRLKSIFERNLVFEDNISSHKKNAISIFYFKNIVAKFFYKRLENNSINDYEVLEAHRLFLKRLEI